MDAELRKGLTAELSKLSGAMAADLRARMLEPGPVQDRARQLHVDEQVGEAFELWTDLLARRAAVLWVLKSVYVRVLEDRGLCRPLRIVDRGSQDLFERLAPSLGETAYLKWAYRDLGVEDGGLPELFALQPAEIVLPSNDLSKALLELWRRRDPDTGEVVYGFAEEHFDGRLMGDLYQDLDPVVKKRFALLQTPDFIVDFILDETLTPAIAEYGVESVRVLDPSCGSGHFLLAAFKRLVVAMREEHHERPVREIVTDVLGRVVGIDLNDYACGLARARLVMTALELSGETRLEAAAAFHPQVFWADALEQVERVEPEQMMLPTMQAEDQKSPALMTRPEVRAALRPVLRQGFHVVVGNPPYITEKDKGKKEYHRALVEKKKRRYVSAAGTYSLAAPFTERMLALCADGAFFGEITANSFMKREFGRALIEEVLARHRLTKVVDLSHLRLEDHGTSTALLFARRLGPTSDGVPVVMGKRGELGTPDQPAESKVWSSIVQGHMTVGYESEFVSVSVVPRGTLAKHPWSIGGGGAAELKTALDLAPGGALSGRDVVIGFGAVTREDSAYLVGLRAGLRLGIGQEQIRPLVEGETVRDWAIAGATAAIWPYDVVTLKAPHGDARAACERALWPYRAVLSGRVAYGQTQIGRGLSWFEYSMFFADRFRTPLSIAFAFVASHNHFVLDRGGKVFNRTAPIIKLPADTGVAEHLALAGQLNSSTGAFWMRQVLQPKGAGGVGGGYHREMWSQRLEYDGSKLERFPLAALRHPSLEAFAARLDDLARSRVDDSALATIDAQASSGAAALRAAFDARRQGDLNRLYLMVGLQEELDCATPSTASSPTSSAASPTRSGRSCQDIGRSRSCLRARTLNAERPTHVARSRTKHPLPGSSVTAGCR
jgi:SAM-dependent methyltransferase